MSDIQRLYFKHRYTGMRLEVLFRRLDHPTQWMWTEGHYWQVEAYQCGGGAPPVAMAWVMDARPNTPEGNSQGTPPPPPKLVDAQVYGECTDLDLGDAVILAAKERWPDLNSDGGATFHGREVMRRHRYSREDTWVLD